MTHSPDRTAVQSHAEAALARLAALELAPTPHNYQTWFCYVAGLDNELSVAIRAVEETGHPFTQEVMDDLHRRFFAANGEIDHWHDIGGRLDDQVQQVLATVSSTGAQTQSYGETLEAVSGHMERGIDAATLQVIVRQLGAATRAMQARAQRLESQLNHASTEVQTLRGRIETIRQEALTDQLTGLANRKCFDDRLAEAVREANAGAGELCLLFGDIDFFKTFNDTWGHQTGDQVLRLVAMCMSENLKGRDTAARYGGEEFTVILPQTSLINARTVAESIRSAVQTKKIVKKSTGETLGTITLSVGVAAFQRGETAENLIQRADACLYAAKRSGRNRVTTQDEVDIEMVLGDVAEAKARKAEAA